MESDRGAKTLGNSWKKLFRTRWCSAVMEQKKEIKGWWDSWGPGIAPCPASVVKTILLTSKLPPLIMSLTFQLESSRLGIPNSGADFPPVSGQPGMPVSEMGTFANSMFGWDLAYGVHSKTPAEPLKAKLGTLACSRQSLVWSRAGFPPRCLNQQGLYDFFKKKKKTTVLSHSLYSMDQTCEWFFHPFQGICGELNQDERIWNLGGVSIVWSGLSPVKSSV